MSSAPSQSEPHFTGLGREARLRVASALACALLVAMFAFWLLDAPLAGLFRGLCSLALSAWTFGEGGHVQFVAASPTQALDRAASWDVSMVLGVEGSAVMHSIALNPRRLLYLPLLTFATCVLGAPLALSARQRRIALLLGIPIVVSIALASVYLIAVFVFARVAGLIYTLEPWQDSVLRVVYEGWVTPLTNKFVMPMLIAAGLLAYAQRVVPSTPPATLSEPELKEPRAAQLKRKKSPRKKQARAAR